MTFRRAKEENHEQNSEMLLWDDWHRGRGSSVSHILCHCDNWKRRTGSPFGENAYFEDSQIVQYFGETSVNEKTSRFGDQKRHFCSTCGTTLYWTLGKWEGHTGIAGGCFTENPLPEPTLQLQPTTRHKKPLCWLGRLRLRSKNYAY